MSSIELHQAGGTRLANREQKSYNKAVARLHADTRLTAVRIDAEAALTGRIMERVVDIDGYRRSLAGNDETLNALLTRVEMGFVAKVERVQRGFGSDLGL